MPEFVILHHEIPALDSGRQDHWDLMLEENEKLLCWAIPVMPGPGVRSTAIQLEDHRPIYLRYQGPISGGRGRVTRVLNGQLEWIEKSDNRFHAKLITAGQLWHVLLERVTDQRFLVAFSSNRPSNNPSEVDAET
jgi:hypothetical protein